MTARGTGGLEFYNSTALEYVHKSYSVFIQTDKAIYKPGHKVQFRAIVLNSHLKPTVTGALDVFITVSRRVKHSQIFIGSMITYTRRSVFAGRERQPRETLEQSVDDPRCLLVGTSTFRVADPRRLEHHRHRSRSGLPQVVSGGRIRSAQVRSDRRRAGTPHFQRVHRICYHSRQVCFLSLFLIPSNRGDPSRAKLSTPLFILVSLYCIR